MTILGLFGPRGPLGDFSNRIAEAHGTGPYTRLGVFGPRGPLGDFSSRTDQSSVRGGGPYTRLGVFGPRGPLGDFTGRVAAPVGNVIDVPVAAMGITPFAPSVLRGQVVDFVGAALVYYPLEPFIDHGNAVTPPVATLTLTPLEPSIENDAEAPVDNYVDAPVALLTLTPLQPQLAPDVTVEPNAASLSLTTSAPEINVGNALLPTRESLVLTPLEPSVEVEYLLDVQNLPLISPLTFAPRVEQDIPGDTIIDVAPAQLTISANLPFVEIQAAQVLHLRQKVRQAAAAVVREEVALTEGRVYESRVFAVDVSQGPYALVYTTSDVVESASLDNPPIQRRLITLVIECAAQAADDLDDVLDAMVLQVEQAMAQPIHNTLGGLAAGSVLVGIDVELATGAQPVGSARMTFEVTCYSVADTPQTPVN